MAFLPSFVALATFWRKSGSPDRAPDFSFVYQCNVCAGFAVRGRMPAVAWGWDPGLVLLVRGRHDAVNGTIYVRSNGADRERPNAVSSERLAPLLRGAGEWRLTDCKHSCSPLFGLQKSYSSVTAALF